MHNPFKNLIRFYLSFIKMVKIPKPIFKAADHSYTSELGKYTSVTTFLHQLEPEKDFVAIAKTFVAKRSLPELIVALSTKYKLEESFVIDKINTLGALAATQLIWKNENIRACTDGTAEHEKRENLVLKQTKFKTKSGQIIPLGIDAKPITNLIDLPDGVYSELLIWNNDLMISGQADLVILTTDEKGKRYCEIQDYKTNKEIKDYNYINSRTGSKVINEYLNAPLNKYCNCNYWIYQLQLNIYAWMLCRLGFNFNGGVIIHIPMGDKRIPLLNLQKDVDTLMLWRSNLLKK